MQQPYRWLYSDNDSDHILAVTYTFNIIFESGMRVDAGSCVISKLVKTKLLNPDDFLHKIQDEIQYELGSSVQHYLFIYGKLKQNNYKDGCIIYPYISS